MDALDVSDRELARSLTPGEKLAQAIEMMIVGVRLKRSSLERQFPDAGQREIDRMLTVWLTRYD
ncbi:MAG TPA: hypothetical protein VJT73_10340 [Polyangiaceae bacterium]|nr:hypothetical protein [Polyangiaceae bacterium]